VYLQPQCKDKTLEALYVLTAAAVQGVQGTT